MFESNINIVISSNQDIFLFQLAKGGEIIYDIYNSSLKSLGSDSLYDKNVLQYSILIDENDIIHLVALMNAGELNYYKYIDKKWLKGTIAKFDMKSNIYNQIEIFMINKKLNIIYNYSNLINSNIWTIQHIVYDNKNEEKHNAIRYISKKFPDHFVVDVDSTGTIHLLYRTNIDNNSQIYHVFYSPYTKAWSSLSKQISLDNTKNLFPFLIIDSLDNLHVLWLEEVNDKFNMKYLRMNSKGKEKYIWKEIKLPYIPISKYPPIIFEENKELKLVFLSSSTIMHLDSTDYGNSWFEGQDTNDLSQNMSLVKVTFKAFPETQKIKYGYCNLSDNPKLYFLNSIFHEKHLPKSSKSLINSEDLNIVEESIDESLEIKVESIYELFNKIDEMLDIIDSIEPIISKILINQENIENKLDNMQKTLDSQKPSFFNRIFN